MQYSRSILIFLASLALFATARPIASASASLEKRGIGWLKGHKRKFRCERHANPFFEKYHLQGQTTYFGEEELKDTVKSVGVMTGWKFKDFGEGKFDAKWNLPIWTHPLLTLEFAELAGVQNLCGTGA